MSLEGSLETVALPEVINLLADTAKTGELRVQGTRGGGRLWFDGGQLTGFEVGRSAQAADAVFDLLRLDSGEFSFDSGVDRPDTVAGEPQDVRPVLEVGLTRLAEWADIVAVVPSVDHVLRLVPEAPADGVMLEPFQWSLIVAIGEGRSVQDVLLQQDLPEFDGCRSLKALVDGALVAVDDPAAGAVEAADEEPEESPTFEPETAEIPDAGDEPPVDQTGADTHVDADADAHPGMAARDALAALLGEMGADSEADPADEAPLPSDAIPSPDGLADRGPWTSGELASLEQMGGWTEDESPAVDAPAVPSYEAEAEPASDHDGQPAYAAYGADDELEGEGAYDAYGEPGAEVDGETESESETPADEPINRGLLLKFLSSVRS